MSNLVKVQTQVTDEEILKLTCTMLQLPAPKSGQHTVYSQRVQGLAVQLPRWNYPVVFDLAERRCVYDNYEGHWGDIKELRTFTQRYAAEAAKSAAVAAGHLVEEFKEGENIRLRVTMDEAEPEQVSVGSL